MGHYLGVQGPAVARAYPETGLSVAVTSTSPPSTATAIPLNANATNPRVVRVVASNPCMLRFGTNGGNCTPTLNSLLVTNNPDYIAVQGLSVFEVMLHTTNPATALFNIQAVE